MAVYELLDHEASPATAARVKRLIDALTTSTQDEQRERRKSTVQREPGR